MSIRDFSKTSKMIANPNDVSNVHLTSCYAGHTPQDNQADFGPISFLLTILGNVPIILVLKMIFSDFPVVWGVLRVTESARKNVGGSTIENRKYSTCWDQKSWCVGGTPRTNARLICRLSRETKQYPIRKRADRRRKHNKHSHGAVQKHLDSRESEMEDQLVNLWQQQECPVKHLFSSLERFCEVSQSGHLVENLLVCGVLSLSHRGTPHTLGAKRLNLAFFVLMFVVSHILKIF